MKIDQITRVKFLLDWVLAARSRSRVAPWWFLLLNHRMMPPLYHLLQATEQEIPKCTKRSCAM
jgi:hypothetical protein